MNSVTEKKKNWIAGKNNPVSTPLTKTYLLGKCGKQIPAVVFISWFICLSIEMMFVQRIV